MFLEVQSQRCPGGNFSYFVFNYLVDLIFPEVKYKYYCVNCTSEVQSMYVQKKFLYIHVKKACGSLVFTDEQHMSVCVFCSGAEGRVRGVEDDNKQLK